MAHSIEKLDGKVAIINDARLIALICMLHLEVTSAPDRYSALRPFTEHWKENLEGYAPGCIQLKLDEMPLSGRLLAELESALTAVQERIQKHGELVPATFLDNISNAPGVHFADFPTSFLFDAIGKIRNLLAPVEVGRS